MFNAIVSGGTKGIGKYISQTLTDMGYFVLAIYKNDHDTAKLCTWDTIACDVTNREDIEKLKLVIADNLIDDSNLIVVNNAGFNDDALIWKMTDDKWSDVLDVTLTGAFHLTRLLIPYMRERKQGTIINISSVVSQLGVAGTSNYATAKAGLDGFTKSLAVELAPKNIRINTIALGYFNTGIISTIPADKLKQILAQVPLRRLGDVTDLSHAIHFLVNCEFYTGQTLNVNGGLK